MLGALIIFAIGLFIGSFLNVLADRLPREESVIKGRSHCEKCKKTLQWFDLIPLASFIFLKGKCRYCHSPLSFYYPIVELITGIMFVVAFIFVINNFPFTNFHLPLISLFYYLFIVSCLIVVFFADLKYGIIPDKIIFPAVLVSFVYIILNTNYMIHIFSGVGAGLFFLLLSLIRIRKHAGMGFGDVKFAFLMGLILGFPNIIVSLYIAFLTGAIVSIILILWRKKKLAGASIPFGPFLVLGTFLALFWGESVFQKAIIILGLR